MDTHIMEISGIGKSFGGLQALDDVWIKVTAHTVHGIIGPNGAGKTTLFNVITGLMRPDIGKITVCGAILPFGRPEQLVPRGIARTFQNIRLFKSLSVLDNVLIGQHVHTPTPIVSIILNGVTARRWEKAASDEAMAALRFVGLANKTTELVRNLSYGQQRLVELARALAAKPTILLLDEPAAGMNPTEKAHLVRLITALQERGGTVVLIEHDMKLVMSICHTITVLDYGKKIAEGTPDHVRNHPEVISAYLGRGGSHAGTAGD
jgi:branched-chain amino acid transport system ATP-binding protein